MRLNKRQSSVLTRLANHASRSFLHSAADLNASIATLSHLYSLGLVYRKKIRGVTYYMVTSTGIDVYEIRVAKLLIAAYKTKNRRAA